MDEVSVEEWKRRGLEGYFVSPGNAAVQRHTVNVIQDIATRYAIDGVHLDYIRYPGRGFDFSKNQRTEFELRYGLDPLELQKDPSKASALLGEDPSYLVDSLYIEWRTEQVDSLVHAVKQAIGKLPLSAAVIPNFSEARMAKGQDWVRWVQRGDVDFVVPMAYTYEPADLARRVELIKRAIGHDRFLIGLPVFDGRSQYLGYSVSLLRKQDILGYSLFSYNALAEDEFTLEFLERIFLQAFQDTGE
jgi:uncharacterized lipoprotein YddW (UPF0748 family)